MQDLTPILKAGKKSIDAYGNGGFRVAGERLEGNVIILPDSVHKFISSSIEQTTSEQLSPIISAAEDVDILLVGCGQVTEFFDAPVENTLRSKKITVEYMSTGAAVRTYNVLLSEERKVAVVLIAV